ncbi:hypothetical protein COU76_00345, partial [Candidatus Peregrinibacteria bacterium CG10_big_fil_rev_8_21_14_0_10_49_10]
MKALMWHVSQNILITHPVNIRYLTGVKLSLGRLLVTSTGMTLFVDSRYTEEVQNTVKKGVNIGSMHDLMKAVTRRRRCLFEGDHVTVMQLQRWKNSFPRTRFLPRSGLVEALRRQKTRQEIRAMKKAECITEEILRRIPSMFRHRPTERELAWKLRAWTQELGADDFSFDPIVAFGKHTSHPHHHLTA